ncbi:MAG TPA: alpha-1,4-glucan--maltose-1-phosphate maltosyltransferase [Polyangiaceae bacterium]|jgi:starch synthase (maltosyl-transferring)|nr:alpha-1,4-glucan--maltose-1-phosphate maltosyltransferase [Polyangiaceae bacterium]
MNSPALTPPQLVIENVTPALDGGRYPIKRVIGRVIEVSADIFKDGHDLIAARILYRRPSETEFRIAPLHYRFDPDRWHGSFKVDQIGLWQYLVEAWPDRFGTWRSELAKRLNAGQDVRPELLEGASLLARLAVKLLGSSRARIDEAAKRLADAALSLDERLKVAFAEDVLELVSAPLFADEATRSAPLEVYTDRAEACFSAWYELFPRSQGRERGKHGTFADTARRLPEIAALGFDVIYLPPIHPIGETHRKGRNNVPTCLPGDVGSPWAIGGKEGGHTAVHPQLGTLADFEVLAASARDFGIEIALDFALQCSPDHPWVKEHPEWFFIRPDGSIRYAENPPKKYEDIYPINFWCKDRQALWNACRDVVLFWIARGVGIFRVDNPHTKPLSFWEWMIRDVQAAHPEAIFLSESFTRPKRMKSLAKLGFTQSYTYFTWKNSAWELRDYLNELTRTEMAEYYRPNFFANTPDILHEFLQTGGRPAFRIRLLLAATLSPTYGIYSGYELCEGVPVHHGSEEYLDSEKYEIRVRDWNAPGNIKQDISKLNRIRREEPALHELTNLSFLNTDFNAILAYKKSVPGSDLIVVVNLDPHAMHETMVEVPLDELGIGAGEAYEMADLLTGARYTWRGAKNYVRLDPVERVGHVFRVSRLL